MIIDCKSFDTNKSIWGCNQFPLRQISDADVIAYAQRSGASTTNCTQKNCQMCFVEAQLRTGRLIYCKQNPGDCPKETKISLGAPATAKKVVGLATVGAELGAAVGISALAATGPLALIAVPIAIWSTISAHHKMAVAREQATICDVVQAWNQYQDTIEAGILGGQIIVNDAKNAIPTMEQQCMASLQVIKDECNAACFFQKAIKALDLFIVERWYDTIGTPLSSMTSSLPGASQNSPAGANGVSPLLLGAGAYGLHLAGAF